MADLRAVAINAANQAGVDPDLYTSLIGNGEGGFGNPGAVSPKGAYAPAGLMPGTARDLGVDPTDPVQNLHGGARYLRQMMDRFGDPSLAAAAYNAGPEAVARHGGVPPYPETQAYVQRVMGDSSPPSQRELEAAFAASQQGSQSPAGGLPPSGGAPPPRIGEGGPGVPYGGPYGHGGVAPPLLSDAYRTRAAAGQIDAKAPLGSERNPYGETQDTPIPANAYGIGLDGSWHTPEPTQDELQAAFDAQQPKPAGPTAPPQLRPGAMPWDNMQAQDAANFAQSDANRAAPLPSIGDAIAEPWYQNVAALKTDVANMFRPPQMASGLGAQVFGGGQDNPVLDAFGHAAGAITAPMTGAVNWGYVNPVSKVTGLDKPFVADSLLALAPETGGQGRVVGFGGPMRPTTSIPTTTARGVASGVDAVAAPFAARFVPGAAEAQAGARLRAAASNPRTALAALQGGPDMIVPGSVPTTFQQTGDMGLGALERGAAVKRPDLFKAREADQNAARVQALGGIQQGGDPGAVQTQIKGALDALDAQTQAHVDALTGEAQRKGGLLGGMGNPEDYGAQTRDLVNTAENAARARESGLWNAVDPEGKLTGNTVATSKAATDIAGQLPPTAKPMEGEEAGIFQTAANLPPVAPVRDLIALRSRLSTEMRNELIANGRSPGYARMSRLRGAIQDNLAGSISDAVQTDDARAARGEIDPQDSTLARLNVFFGDSSGVEAGRGARVSAGAGNPRGGSAGVPGGYGTEGASARGLVGAPRVASVPPGLGAARADVSQLRAGQTGGLFRAMQELGGIKLRNPDGSLVPGPDVSSTLEGLRVPGLVNNARGLSPEQMAEALHERGFFGSRVTDPSGAFEAAVDRHASGSPVYPEGAYEPGTADRIASTREELSAAGVGAFDRPEVAARKLADYRDAASDLIGKAETYGVAHEGRPLEDVWGDVAEREAIQGDAGPDPHAAEFDRLVAGAPKLPTFDPAAAGRLNVATAATKERAGTFGQQPVSAVTARSGGANQFRLPDGRVAGRFFHPGPTGFSDMQALLKASPEAAPVIQDYAASTLRRTAMREDGTLDPAKFAKWQAQHSDALRALPADQQARFADAATASRSLADAATRRADAIKTAQSGVLGKMIGAENPQEVVERIGRVLSGPTRIADMQTLAKETASNPDARAGLRQAVADHMSHTFIGNTEAGTSGIGTMRADPFQSFVRQARPALAKVFTQPELDSIQAIADDLVRSKRSQTAVKLAGSNTSQDGNAAGLFHGQLGTAGLITHSILEGLGLLGGHLIGGEPGAILGGSISPIASTMTNAFRAQGIARVDDLVTRALLDPKVARALLQKAPKGALTPGSMQGRVLMRALGGEVPDGTPMGQPFGPPRVPLSRPPPFRR